MSSLTLSGWIGESIALLRRFRGILLGHGDGAAIQTRRYLN